MNKRIVALILSMAMVCSLALTGCGASGSGAKESGESQSVPVSSPEQSAQQDASGSAVAKDVQVLNGSFSLPTGGMVELTKPSDTEKVSQEEISRMDRAMRDFVPKGESLVVNNASSFYYYEHLSDELQSIYDTLFLVCQHPDEQDYYNMMFTSEDPNSQSFVDKLCTAYFAMLYDHPELFWLYNSCETDLCSSTSGEDTGMGYCIYFFLDHPVENFEAQQTAFNNAAEAFLSDIDLSAGDEAVAKAIHDKLVDTVTYNTPVMESHNGANLAHTAYGALVADSDGTPNYAVCDGYSLAYVYLLQQCGMDAVFVGGKAGADESAAGGHAWSMVKINGKWEEVDSTWDDAGTLEDQITEDIQGYEYYLEAVTDSEYRNKLEHQLFQVSTDQITRYEPDLDYYQYFTKDGQYVLVLVSSSVHIRDTAADTGPMGAVIELAPVAEAAG